MPDKFSQSQIRKVDIADLTPDDRNANKGTERGNYALGKSIESHGLGRSILLDKDGRIIAGNKTHAKAGELGFEEVIIVPTDGKTLVAVQRMDISLDSPEGRGLAVDDNRAGELGLEWDVEELIALHDEGLVDLNERWTQAEIDGLVGAFEEPGDEDWGESFERLPDGERAPFQQITFTLHDDQAEQVRAALDASKKMGEFDSENENSNGNALARICEVFLNGNG